MLRKSNEFSSDDVMSSQKQMQMAQFTFLAQDSDGEIPPDDCHYCINAECPKNFFTQDDQPADTRKVACPSCGTEVCSICNSAFHGNSQCIFTCPSCDGINPKMNLVHQRKVRAYHDERTCYNLLQMF